VTDKPRNEIARSDEQLILVIDDDVSMRQALTNLLESIGLHVAAFGTARELLEGTLPAAASCMILDIRLPGLSGLDLQTELAKAKVKIPIIFMTGHGDIPMTVKAMKSGAIDFLTKPFRDQDLLDAVATALDRDRKRRNDEKIVTELQTLVDALTPRERQVMTLVTEGLMNKQIAHERQPDEKNGGSLAGGFGANGGRSRLPAHEGTRALTPKYDYSGCLLHRTI
jgi:FixJ family two-component response regulator